MLWNEDQLPRVKKERKPTLRGVFSGRHTDNVPKETIAPGNSGEGQRRKGSGNKEESSLGKSEIPCRLKFGKTTSCKFWHPPHNYKLEKDVFFATNVISDMLRQKESPTKSKRKVVEKDQLRYWRRRYYWYVCLKILIRESLLNVKKENWDRNTPSNPPKALGTKLKFGKERVHREVLSKSGRLMSVVLGRQHSGKDHMRKPSTQKDAPEKQDGIWRKTFTCSRIRTQLRSFLLLKQG